VYKPRRDGAAPFAELLDAVAAVDPEVRVRFTSPHPKDFADDVLQARGAGGSVVARVGGRWCGVWVDDGGVCGWEEEGSEGFVLRLGGLPGPA
jgi:hypothetical protein